MDKQIIISIAREYGAGGHKVAEILANKYNLTLYDNQILEKIAEEKGINTDELKKFSEKKRNIFLSRTVSGYSNSPQDIVAEMEFDFLREKAAAGESFVVVGRCANSILKEYDGLISIFVTSDMEDKIKRVKAHNPELSDKEAERMISLNNRKRKTFHNYHCKERWGDSRYYEITISTAKIGVENASAVIDKYVKALIEKND